MKKIQKIKKAPAEASPEEIRRREKLPLFAKILFGVAALGLAVYLAALISTPFADFYNVRVGSLLRALLSWLTVLFPFSLAEMMIILLIPALVLLVLYANRHYTDSWREVGVFALCILSVLSLFFSLFALGFGPGYQASPLDQKLGLDRRDVAVEELKRTSQILADEVNANLAGNVYLESGSSEMPYGYTELSRRLMAAYDKVCEEYDFIQHLHSRVKPVMLSKPWTYTHITGVYTYFTGEANININMPDYTIPYTAAHELAHQRGIAREDEANFVAFLVCAASEDAYIRYSGYLSMFEYVAGSLYRADADAYWSVLGTLDPSAVGEIAAYNAFFDKYRRSVAAKVTEKINDTYLQAQGTPGTQSYGMVVDLAVAYYREK